MKTKQVLRFFTVCIAIVLTFGNAVVGFTPVAVADVPGSTGSPAGTITLVSGWNPVGYRQCNNKVYPGNPAITVVH
jgi:hypothetical protein